MKTIIFLPEDYDDLTSPNVEVGGKVPAGRIQYMQVYDCPFARAAIRCGVPSTMRNGEMPNDLKYCSEDIDLIRQRLLAGEQSVMVELYVNNTYKIL